MKSSWSTSFPSLVVAGVGACLLFTASFLLIPSQSSFHDGSLHEQRLAERDLVLLRGAQDEIIATTDWMLFIDENTGVSFRYPPGMTADIVTRPYIGLSPLMQKPEPVLAVLLRGEVYPSQEFRGFVLDATETEIQVYLYKNSALTLRDFAGQQYYAESLTRRETTIDASTFFISQSEDPEGYRYDIVGAPAEPWFFHGVSRMGFSGGDIRPKRILTEKVLTEIAASTKLPQ